MTDDEDKKPKAKPQVVAGTVLSKSSVISHLSSNQKFKDI